MKKFIAGIIIFAAGAVFTYNSCNSAQPDNEIPNTALSAINKDPSLTIFSTIVNYSGDENYINNSKAIVVPVDSAFISAGITRKIAAKLSPPECDSIVMYYTILNGINFDAAPEKEIGFSSGLGTILFADSTNSGLYFNGISAISEKPSRVGKSAIYKLTHYIQVPAETISAITSADTSLTLFNEALKRTNFTSMLSGRSLTLFMPVNNAFKKAGFHDKGSIDRADINTLLQILMYQTVPNNYFENDLEKQTSLNTLQGKTLRVAAKYKLKLIGNSSRSSSASLLNKGILADNVLTYKTSDLLLP